MVEQTNEDYNSSVVVGDFTEMVKSRNKGIEEDINYGDKERGQDLENAAKLIIKALGEDITAEGLSETPRRFREMFMEDFWPGDSLDTVLGEMVMEESFDQMVIVKDIPIRSHCEHHILPWWGKVCLGYIPHAKTVGLSKMTRMVDAAGKGLTIQERVTDNIAQSMNRVLDPKGVMIVVEAVHMCTLMRGVKTEMQRFTTSTAKGVFLTNSAPRQEFLTLFAKNGSLI
jgi:GTP cyclohydrolase I